MLFYITLFLFISILSLLYENNGNVGKKNISIIMLILLTLVTGLRYNGGSDLELYEYVYNRIPLLTSYNDFFDCIGSIDYYYWEPYFLLYNSLFKTIGLSFFGFLFVDSIIFYTCLYWGYKKYTTHWGILLMFFMYKIFFYETFVAMRQCMSIAMFFLIMHLIEEKKTFKYYFLCIFLVIPFHYGAVILLFAYLSVKIRISRKFFLGYSLFLLPFAFLPQFFSRILSPLMLLISAEKGSAYLSEDSVQNIFYTFETYLVVYLVYANYGKLTKIHSAEFMIKFLIILLPCITIFRDVIILRREMDYFYLCIPVLLGYICDVNKQYSKSIMIIMTVICFYGYIRYITNFDGGEALIPYKAWLNIPNASFFL